MGRYNCPGKGCLNLLALYDQDQSAFLKMSQSRSQHFQELAGPIKKLTDSQFVCKLCDMMEKYPDIVCWSPDGRELIIADLIKMEKVVLPLYFRHSNFTSFVRQLNMYNFHKLYKKDNLLSFQNQIFRRGNSQNYHFIQRKRKNRQPIHTNLRLDSEYQNTLKRIKTDSKLNEGMKVLLTIENIKKIKQHLDTVCRELKESRSKKVTEIIAELRNNNIAEINDNITLAKQIDKYVASHFEQDLQDPQGQGPYNQNGGMTMNPNFNQNMNMHQNMNIGLNMIPQFMYSPQAQQEAASIPQNSSNTSLPIFLQENNNDIKQLGIENKQSFKSQNSLINLPSENGDRDQQFIDLDNDKDDSASISFVNEAHTAYKNYQHFN